MTSILIIRLSSIGDIFHTFTILPDIKSKYPQCKIDWLVDKNFEQVVTLSPLVDNVISIPLRNWKKNKLTWLIKLIKYKQCLSTAKYDYIIDTQGLIKSAWIAKVLFKGKLYGLDSHSAREKLASCFYDYTYNINQEAIAVIRLRSLIASIFDLKLDYNQIEFPILKSDCGINEPNGFILFLHGTSKQNKKWSIDNWVKLAIWILVNTKKSIYLTYSNDDEYQFSVEFKRLVNDKRINVIKKLEFRKLTDLINNADLVIGVDTGFMHLANLMNRPTIAIYLNSNPSYVGIIQNDIAYSCGGLHQAVKPEQVIDYIKNYRFHFAPNCCTAIPKV